MPDGPGLGEFGVVTGFRSANGHRIIERSENNRSGATTVMWDIDDLCRGPTPAAPSSDAASGESVLRLSTKRYSRI